MSLAKFLDIVYPGKPAFVKESWIQGAAPRHLWLFAAISNFTKHQKPGDDFSLLEVGTWMGSSLLTWAEALEKYNEGKGSITCVDPMEPYFDANQQSDAIENPNPEYAKSQAETLREMDALLAEDFVYEIWNHNRKLIPESLPVSLIREASATALPKLRDASFHMIYVDGSHFFEDVLGDLREAQRLIKPGGIICGDDLELKRHQCDVEFARAHKHLDYPTDPITQRQFHPGVTLAVGETFEDVSLYDGFWMVQKTQDGFQPYYLDHYQKNIPSHFVGQVKDYYLDYTEKYFQQARNQPINGQPATAVIG